MRSTVQGGCSSARACGDRGLMMAADPAQPPHGFTKAAPMAYDWETAAAGHHRHESQCNTPPF
jgi:hypothetical protein